MRKRPPRYGDPSPHLTCLDSTSHNPASFPGMLLHYARSRNLAAGKLIHASIVEKEHQINGYLSNVLLQMYGQCGSLVDAHVLFGKMEVRDAFSWSTLIDAYTHQEQMGMAFELFRRMQLENAIPNKFTFLSVLPSCSNRSVLRDGKHIHVLILSSDLELDAFLGTSLIHMYCKCESLTSAQDVFDAMQGHNRNVVTWTTILAAYIQQFQCENASQFFQQMLLEGVLADKILFVSIFDGCNNLMEVKRMHASITVIGHASDVIIKNALVKLYARFGMISDALHMFEDISQRTVVSWTTIISVYVQHDRAREASQLFQQMLSECVFPDNVTFVNGFAACTKISCLHEGKRMHCCFLHSDCVLDMTVHNAIVHLYAYAQHGQLRESIQLYCLMNEDGLFPDKVTFISILEGCIKKEALAEGMWVHNHMLDNGFGLDVMTATALIEMYGRCGNFGIANDIFENLQERDVVVWTAIIVVCIHTDQNRKAVQLFHHLQMEAMMPNNVTFVNVILACGNQSDEREGKYFHAQTVACRLEEDAFVGTALVDLYSKCGNVEEARRIFDILPERDSFSWNAMITAYAQHGNGEGVLWMFENMQVHGVMPDEITFSVILCACSHTGFINTAYENLSMMISETGGKSLVDFCVRLVDLLSRAGQLSDGEDLINRMPFQPFSTFWATLLGACGLHLDLYRGMRTASYALELTPEDAIPYVALANLYAAHENL